MHKTVSNILLLGSCNGQDSLGDVCLLRSVIQQVSNYYPDAHITVHINEVTAPVRNMIGGRDIETNWGLQTLFWRWRSKWRHTRLPLVVCTFIAALLFPVYMIAAGLIPARVERKTIAQILRADFVYIYGGTNFAKRWYWLNTPYFVLTMLLGRCSGARIVLGPQQYGPMTTVQKLFTKLWLKLLVNNYYLRNSNCLDELDVPEGEAARRLLFDEVYSNTNCYPLVYRRHKEPKYILVNIRGGNLSEEGEFLEKEMERLGFILSTIQNHYRLPVLWFAVSGESFCNDASGAGALRSCLDSKYEFQHLDIHDEYQLIESAKNALACISMSFHGCVLSIIAGIPSIPIVDGEYYEYKYADFDRYGDGGKIPTLRLMGQSAGSADLINYITSYDTQAATDTRTEAANAIRRAYTTV